MEILTSVTVSWSAIVIGKQITSKRSEINTTSSQPDNTNRLPARNATGCLPFSIYHHVD